MYGYPRYLDDVDKRYPRIRISADLKSTIEDLQVEMKVNTNEKALWELIKEWRKSHPKYIQQQPEATLPVV